MFELRTSKITIVGMFELRTSKITIVGMFELKISKITIVGMFELRKLTVSIKNRAYNKYSMICLVRSEKQFFFFTHFLWLEEFRLLIIIIKKRKYIYI